jgi:hypothetical protein
MRTRLIPAALLAALVAISATTAGAAPPIAHPRAARAVVLRVATGGGFVPVQVNLGALPEFSLYGDGSAIVPTTERAPYPGPALPRLRTIMLREAGVQALLRKARSAGLLARGAIDYGDMGTIGVSDAPTTTVTLNANGIHVSREAYALSIGSAGSRLTPAQQRARRALARYVSSLPGSARSTAYVPRALAVYAMPATGAAPAGSRTVRWPLARDLARAGSTATGAGFRCMLVRGADARTLRAALRHANVASRWKATGTSGTFSLVVRPLLPDERSCDTISR